MAYSYQEFIGDGQTQDFNVPFTYVKPSEVNVYVDGVQVTDFEFTSSSTLHLASAPASGLIVRISRSTDLENRAVDFVAGAVLSEEDLDTALQQVFNGAQEAVDKTTETIAKIFDGSFDAQSRIISNVADAVADTDAVNKRSAIAITSGLVTQAQQAASTATTGATTATTKAGEANSSAIASSNSASASANSASTAAQTYSNTVQVYNNTVSALNAAKIPSSLAGKAKQFLQVKADSTGYELVQSVAAPSFYGFNMSADGQSIEMTYGRDGDLDVDDFETWTMSENITFEVRNNNLVVVL